MSMMLLNNGTNNFSVAISFAYRCSIATGEPTRKGNSVQKKHGVKKRIAYVLIKTLAFVLSVGIDLSYQIGSR